MFSVESVEQNGANLSPQISNNEQSFDKEPFVILLNRCHNFTTKKATKITAKVMVTMMMMMIMMMTTTTMAKMKDSGVVVLKMVMMMILTYFVSFSAESRERRHAHLPEV